MKQLNEKELAVFCGFAVLGAPDPISGEVAVTLEERKALYRALRLGGYEVAKEEFESIESMYDKGEVTIDSAVENLKTKKPAVQAKIYKSVHNSVKVLAGNNQEKMLRGDRKVAMDDLKEKMGLSESEINGTSINKKVAPDSSTSKGKSLMFAGVFILILAAGVVWYLKMKH